MIFRTESGSVYEVEDNRIRRLSGKNDPTDRQHQDGEWRTFAAISDITVGWKVLITWPKETPLLEGSPDHAIPATLTSRVVE